MTNDKEISGKKTEEEKFAAISLLHAVLVTTQTGFVDGCQAANRVFCWKLRHVLYTCLIAQDGRRQTWLVVCFLSCRDNQLAPVN